MPNAATWAWGKLDRNHPDRESAPRLTLVAHSLDVAAVARALLQLPTWRKRLERLAGKPFNETDLDRLTVLAFLHDVGKAGAGFQAKALPDDEQARWRKNQGCGRAQQGHTKVMAPLLGHAPEFKRHREALGVADILLWGGASSRLAQQDIADLWLASVSHHGDPIAWGNELLAAATSPSPTWIAQLSDYDPVNELARLRQTATSTWPAAFALGAPDLRPSQALIHAFAGLVSLADWIGSDTRHFRFDLAAQDQTRWAASVAAASQALRAMRIDVEDMRVDLQQRSATFESIFGFSPTEVQVATAEMPAQSPVVLEAETGSGKTEAALWRFKALFEAGEVDSLCFLLPTRVAATGISKRLEDFTNRLFPDPDCRPNTVLAVPGYLRANSAEGHWLAPFTVQWPDREVGDPLFWAAENSKRFFAASMAAATIDQFLLSTLQTKHAHLRGCILLRSLVVVDEVHASDPYMRAILGKALRRHHAAGGHALLLSATLTSDLREELMRTAPAPRTRLGAPTKPLAPPLPLDYPRLSTPVVSKTFGEVGKHKLIRCEMQPWMRDARAVARRAAEALAAGARVLILRNTVRQAVATHQALEELLGLDHPALFRCRGIVAMHHGRYALPDRRALDEEVGARFGKAAAGSRDVLALCATQTVEISVDCDADFLMTDLAPMDVLLQRLGRLHRHADRQGSRPMVHREPHCIVLTPPSTDLSNLLSGGAARGLGIGSRSAYPDLLTLQATVNLLADHQRFPLLDIPTHNRELVEQACGRPALLQLAQALGGEWPEHQQVLQGQASAQGSTAVYQCIDYELPWREAVPGELSTEAKTRLGLDSIDLVLPSGIVSPFGHALTSLSMPAWMLPSLPDRDDAGPPAVEALVRDADGFQFNVRGRAFSYTRLGLAQI